MEIAQPQPQTRIPAILMHAVSVGSLQDPEANLLTDVEWRVDPGDFWVIAGLQGSGKSDLLMLAGGLMAPLAGEYRLFDEPMPIFEEDRLPHRLRLGLVFENGQLFNHLTVRENVGLPLRYHHNLSRPEALPIVDAVLERMELGPWADSTPGALGRNWHKRVGLARALMLKPEVLLLDNPLTGLDLRHLYWTLDLLTHLAAPGNFVRPEPITLVVTTPDLRPWTNLARQFAVIKNRHMIVLGDQNKLESASEELLSELLAPQSRNG
jgi:ABC-type transporter Mla maintaining outer membrane lipid asymmetry ATPase subunit MlaF